MQAKGRQFDPDYLHQVSNAGVAQLVEQLTCNEKVEGSNPFSGTSFASLLKLAGVAKGR